MTGLSKRAVSTLATILLVGGGLLAPAQAKACCAYNDTDFNIKYAWSGARDWHLSAHDKQCENGKGGTMNVWLVLDMASDFKLCDDLEVDDHGWVSVYHNSYTFTTVSYASDGTVKRKCVVVYRDD